LKITGKHTIQAPRQEVFDRLIDPDSIATCLPGVEKLEKLGEDEYSMSMNVGIGMVKGTYNGKVRLSNMNKPTDYQMYVDGSGRPGFIKGTGTVRLAEGENSTTDIEYEGDVEVGGPIGSVAQRMLGGVANRMVGQFFGCIESKIKGD
jgi:carbon monoxide dehydrogenase subunit G